jgi:hypothetical protein
MIRRRVLQSSLSVAAALATRRASAATRALATVTVKAGGINRLATVVNVAAPHLTFEHAELRGRDGVRLPVTRSPDGRLTFVVPKLGPGRSARYELLPRDQRIPGDGVRAVRADDGISFVFGENTVLRYQSRGVFPRNDIPTPLLRGGYIHPVMTPSGRAVTDDYPPNHLHHHGVWTSWTSTEFRGRKPDFWNMGQKKGKTDFVSLGDVWEGPSSAGLRARHLYTDLLVTPPEPALEEEWRLAVHRTHPNRPPYHLFDLEITQKTTGPAPLTLLKYHYGGLGLRGPRAWDGKANTTFLTSEGKSRSDGNETVARWAHMGGTVEGRQAGLAVLIHPGNFRAPQPLRLHPN